MQFGAVWYSYVNIEYGLRQVGAVNFLEQPGGYGMAQVIEPLVWYILVKPEVPGSIPQKFRIARIIIPACFIKQPNGTLSRQCGKRRYIMIE